jgi:cell division protein FtsN
MNGRRLGARDYKRPRRGGLDIDGAQLRGFALGLGLGLIVAAVIYIGDHRVRAAAAQLLRPVPEQRAPDDLGLRPDASGARTDARAADSGGAADSEAADPAAAAPATLRSVGSAHSADETGGGAGAGTHTTAQVSGAAPAATVGKFDFYQMLPRAQVLVPAREHVSHVAPTAPVEQPGTYFLQVGSYRDAGMAEHVRAEVTHLGISATVQRIAAGSEVWHRVRIGPVRDLGVLNRLRRQLQAAKLDSLVVRTGD